MLSLGIEVAMVAEKSTDRTRLLCRNCSTHTLEHISGKKRKDVPLGLTLPREDSRVFRGHRVKANLLSRWSRVVRWRNELVYRRTYDRDSPCPQRGVCNETEMPEVRFPINLNTKFLYRSPNICTSNSEKRVFQWKTNMELIIYGPAFSLSAGTSASCSL